MPSAVVDHVDVETWQAQVPEFGCVGARDWGRPGLGLRDEENSVDASMELSTGI